MSHNGASRDSARIRSYVIGFVGSLVLTLTAYFLVMAHVQHGALAKHVLFASLAVLAFLQFVLQLVLFLHIGHEMKPRWKIVTFLCTVVTVGILVIGSLWIMQNLNYHMHSDHEIRSYMSEQDGL